MCGALDGTHIRLHQKPPQEHFPAQYVSRHGFPSIVLQGIVDARKMFWSVVCNAPGGMHDSTHFKGCLLYKSLKRGEVLNTPTITMHGHTIRPYVVADSAYKATSFLVKPFREVVGEMIETKIEFDRHLSKGRVKVENAFGILKNRWRILRELHVALDFSPNVVGACCVLHNFVQMRGEVEPQEQNDPHPNGGGGNRAAVGSSKVLGRKLRMALFRHFRLRLRREMQRQLR